MPTRTFPLAWSFLAVLTLFAASPGLARAQVGYYHRWNYRSAAQFHRDMIAGWIGFRILP